ncbi:hypothetical protein F511_35387 [Dorcoceras hygrometricum]|uniref:Uncharacterized protein n=1 Tax=Dorcoceras hygrometricum TaxID=472368 RepID=A0A2Z7CU81_9LAMI|nr:hypothetical protein F511_35387 [Dorcoceras hygrometricum]
MLPEIRRAAAANIACGAWPHAAAPSAASPRNTVSRAWRTAARTPLNNLRVAAAHGRPPCAASAHGPRSETISLQSACTRKLMDFGTDGNSSSRWPEQVRQEAAARGGADGGAWPKSHSLKSSSYAQHVELSFRAGIMSPRFIHYYPSDSIGYPRMRASGESSTTKHRLLHASGSHPIPPPNDPKTNQYNQDLGLIHSTNGNHLESPNEGSSIDHQVTIHQHAQNITMFPTNETWYFISQTLVSNSGGLILILTAQSTRNEFRIHSDYYMCFMIAVIPTITSNIHYGAF